MRVIRGSRHDLGWIRSRNTLASPCKARWKECTAQRGRNRWTTAKAQTPGRSGSSSQRVGKLSSLQRFWPSASNHCAGSLRSLPQMRIRTCWFYSHLLKHYGRGSVVGDGYRRAQKCSPVAVPHPISVESLGGGGSRVVINRNHGAGQLGEKP